jgi:hypothetical protein
VARWEPAAQRAVRLRRVRDWLAARGIALVDEEVQVNAWFAMSMLGEALMHIMDSFSRDYLLEQVEHGLNVTILPSMYPHLSVGRDMRVAAHEVYIGGDGRALTQSDAVGVAPCAGPRHWRWRWRGRRPSRIPASMRPFPGPAPRRRGRSCAARACTGAVRSC